MHGAVEGLGATGWDDLPGLPIWLRTHWLAAFARALCVDDLTCDASDRLPDPIPGRIGVSYLTFHHAGQLVGVALLQALPVVGMRLGRGVPPRVARRIFGGHARQLGQVLFAGPGGVHFVEPGVAGPVLAQARLALAARLDGDSTWLIKDLTAPTPPPDWQALRVLPDLVLAVPPAWRTFEDYLAALPSKYRRRARRARRLGEGLTVRTLGTEELERYEGEIDALYRRLIARAPYVPYRVPDGYVTRLATTATVLVEVRGYFDGARLVGFSTILFGGVTALAHFAAVDEAYNATHQLYLNLLLDLLDAAIGRGVERLHYGRTATTIKSSLGAVPTAFHSYAAHDGRLRHALLSALNARVLAGEEVVEEIRRPFG